MPDFSFIVLTYNEELQLPRFFQSVKELGAKIYVLDSGSTDSTLAICKEFGVEVLYHPFSNHPSQWDAALKAFAIQTPWIIGLDADQSLDPALCNQLKNFRDAAYTGIDGVYFCRKYFFRGKWIRFGGYQQFYLLKMFRTGAGYSDLNENMDHRFLVPGKSVIWKEGFLLEENHKENRISFWIDKHNRYSDLIASEEVERLQQLRNQVIKTNIFGNPDERRAYMKSVWWKLPRYIRPFIYFTHRMFFRFGFLDGRTGMLFHFLHAFWFRLMVDVKIGEVLRERRIKRQEPGIKTDCG